MVYFNYLILTGIKIFPDNFVFTSEGLVVPYVSFKFQNELRDIKHYAYDAKKNVYYVNNNAIQYLILYLLETYKEISDEELIKEIKLNYLNKYSEQEKLVKESDIIEDIKIKYLKNLSTETKKEKIYPKN